ncbi:hypothetical protein BC939DRAFT_448405 [Gamsiella multidivaricata]|uniref:uncharacterized protein n=1 Tax=Gamsiella multidivaricata TaxID=101098 RepID=UPI00221F7058|nr:uncharacterized protein BC939DRAFT_448405 [Gamsiella multidivaricata]KAG0370803.1 hypothetical protein BGZ54_003799 [Gamsiella multidivaricata]KAI7825274.1 hypothetical protein BC939DRAFT_448405 [Gamsiella multidivaricata]
MTYDHAASPTSPTSPTSPLDPLEPMMKRRLPGGINPNATIIDKDHPLITVDPTLNAVLETLNSQILAAYRKAKLLPASTATDQIQLKPVSFTTQVVEGTNYFVKLSVIHSDASTQQDEYIHVRIYSRPWTQTTELRGVAVNKRHGDSLQDPIPAMLDEIPSATVY